MKNFNVYLSSIFSVASDFLDFPGRIQAGKTLYLMGKIRMKEGY
jgi:hypothetical protein